VNRTLIVQISICLLFLNTWFLNSQTNVQEERPLVEVLREIETRFRITFNFADENVIGIKVVPPPTHLTLEQTLTYLSEETGLDFSQLGNRSAIIKRKVLPTFTNTQFLDEVIVTNYLTKGVTLKEGGITDIRPQDFEILPGLIEPDVLHTIQALPGVLSVDERVSNINVRGGTNDQNLILWDGIKMYQTGHFFGLISAFNPYLTEDVVVQKNGTSAVYGDGVSSVIDMKSSNEIGHLFTGGAGLNLVNVDAHGKIPIGKKTEFQFSARRSITDMLSTPTYDAYFERIFQDTDLTSSASTSQNERFYFYDFSGKLMIDITEKDKVMISALNIYNNLNYQETSTINDRNEALNSMLVQHNLALGISHSRRWNDRLNTSTEVYFSNYDLDATNFDLINIQRLIQENEVYDTGLKLHAEYKLRNNLNYFGGYQFNEVGISNLEDVNNPPYRSYIKEVIRSHAIFNEIKFISNSNQTNARIGLRTNYIEKFSEFYVEPRFSFSQKFLNNFRFELLGEIKSQYTTQIIDLQNDFLGVEKRRWILANNLDIPVVESGQVSAGLQYNRRGFLISADAYIKRVDGITTRSQGFQNQYQLINAIGQYDVKGIDFLVQKRFENVSTWISYSYSDNDYTFENLNNGLSFPNNADVSHALTFAGTMNINNLKLAIGANWRTGKPFTEINQSQPISNNRINYNKPNSSRLSDYFRTDFSATYKLNFGDEIESIAGFSLWNVLDRKNIINSYYRLEDELSDNPNIIKVENYSLGITPNFSFRVNF
jgi:hypothetical protein